MSPDGPPYYKLGEIVTISNHPIRKNLNFPISLIDATPKVDVYFVLDATFTNRFIVKDARTAFATLMDQLSTIVADVTFGLAIFRDESELWNGFENVASLSKKPGKVRAALNKVEPKGGLDYFESNLAALYQAATNRSVGWRKSARKVIVMAAAFVGHEPTCTGALPRLTRKVVAETLADAAIMPVFYSAPGDAMDAATVPYGCDGAETAGPGQTSYIAEETGGVLIPGMSRNVDVPKIFNAVKASLLTLSVDAGACKRFANVTFNQSLDKPLAYADTVELKVSLLPQVCATKPNSAKPVNAECNLRFLFNKDNSSANVFSLKFQNVTGCPLNDPK